MSPMHRTQIYLEDAQVAALDARAKMLGVTRSDLIRAMIEKGLAANDGKPSLHETLKRLGPPTDDPAITHEAFAERRRQFEDEFNAREARFSAQRRGESD